ncbi:MAG: Xaa-Pro peptidase family protein [Bacillota bacterium]
MTDDAVIPVDAFDTRVDALRGDLGERGLDGLLVTSPDNVRYLTGFPWGVHSYLLVAMSETVLIVRPTEHQQAIEEAKVSRIVLAGEESAEKLLARELEGMPRVGFEPDFLHVDAFDQISEFRGRDCLLPASGLVTEMRAIKEPWEVDLIGRACRIFDLVMEKLVPELSAGMTENEILGRAEQLARLEGADGFWFPSIVLSGPRSALPHGMPTSRPARGGEFLKLDLGPTFAGYASDATRTLAFGPASGRMKEVYRTVLRAQLAALDSCRAGVPCCELHNAAARVIEDAGYGQYFNHPVGHGVWGPPLVGADSNRPLEAGMVITVEPGIYIPGWGGVRIEDSVVVTEEGCQILHSFPKDMVVV